MYSPMASSISGTLMYSSAVWEREDSPGPIFRDGKRISAWSDSVGEPKGVRPKSLALLTSGWFSSMREEFSRKERAFTSLPTWAQTVRKMSGRVIISLKHRPEGLQLNGEHIRTIDRIHAGDTLSVTMEDTPPDYLESEIRVPILYEDEDVMVYNKPVDMPCHQAKTHQQDTLANVFARDCRERGLSLSYRCINRLDRNTSGAVVVAKNAHAATVLGGVGRGGIQVHKRYTALLTGILPYERGMIDAGIARIDEETINRMVDNAGQPARTGFEVLGYGYRHTLAEFSLYTGRTHQIRVHMWWLGYPLAGDDIYGWDFDLIGRHALHCGRIWFPHPVTGERIEVPAPLPEDFREAVRRAGVRPKSESAHFKEKR